MHQSLRRSITSCCFDVQKEQVVLYEIQIQQFIIAPRYKSDTYVSVLCYLHDL